MKKNYILAIFLLIGFYSFSQFITPQAYLTFEDGVIIPSNVTGISSVDASGNVTLANPAGTYAQAGNSIVNDAGENVLFTDYEGYLKFDGTILNKNTFTLTANYKWTGNNAWWLGLISFVGHNGTNYVTEHLQLKNSNGEINGLGLTAANALPPDAYYHIALTYSNGNVVLYINGSQVASSTGQGIHNWTNPSMYLSLKTAVNASTGAVTPFVDGGGNSKNTQAYMDKVALFDRALSAAEVSEVYAGELDLNHITVFPEQAEQSLAFGGDAKLNIKNWAEDSQKDLISQKLFGDMDLEIFRIPIYALQPITDPVYDSVVSVVNSVKAINPNVKIFASIANGDGYGTHHHGESKFPASWRGCCPYNVYDLNLTTYAAYLDSFMDKMTAAGITVDYLGPWNEDAADDSDHFKVFDQMTKLGTTQKIGVERWALQSSVNDVDDIEDRVDIVGSHFYDDDQINEASWEATWASLVSKSEDPVWYTESTRYKTSDHIDHLVAGMDNIFPAIRAGVTKVIFYQAYNRFVGNGGVEQAIKYTGFKNIVNNSGGHVRPSTSDNAKIKVVAFANGTTLDVHILSKNSTDETVKLQLSGGYKTNGQITRTIWTAQDTAKVNTYTLTDLNTWNITAPANSYSHLKIPLNMGAVQGTASKARMPLGIKEEHPSELAEMPTVPSTAQNEFAVYPNPSRNGLFNLRAPELGNNRKMTLQLFNTSGTMVFSQTIDPSEQVAIDSKLPNGLYYMRMSDGQKVYTKKIVFAR